jgi:hypothetical protein
VGQVRAQALHEGLPHVHADGPDEAAAPAGQALGEVAVRVSRLRSWPIHTGSPVSRLLTTVRNFTPGPRLTTGQQSSTDLTDRDDAGRRTHMKRMTCRH